MATRIEIKPNDATYLVWAGDGTKNDANAVFYIKNNGDAYFGGSLTAGALVAEVRSTTINSALVIETGIFGTNGNPKDVTFSMSYMNIGRSNTDDSASTSATIRLDRSYNGGAWTEIASTSCSGSRTYTYEPEPGFPDYLANVNCSGSSTYTDNQAGTGTFNYRLRITGASGWPWTLIGGTGGSQTTRIKSVED